LHTTAVSIHVLESCSFASPFQFPNQHYDQPAIYQDIDRLIVKTPAVLLPAHRGLPDADGLLEIGIVRNNNTWLLDANGKVFMVPVTLSTPSGKPVTSM
jgi:hypothetical protein